MQKIYRKVIKKIFQNYGTPTTHKGNCRHKVTLPPLVAELYRKAMKKYFETMERLEQFEPNYVHTLPAIHKGNCRHKLTVPPLGAELYRKVMKKIFQNYGTPRAV
jgi:hypothetical protein